MNMPTKGGDWERCWCVVVGRGGDARPLPVYCATENVALATARNLPRHFAVIGLEPALVTSASVVPATGPLNPVWPVWKHVTKKRMLDELPRLLLSLCADV